MIIFINGAFGVGKTTIAQKMIQVLPDSMLYDPEEVGYMLWNILRPIGLDGDFQDYVAWRSLVPLVGEVLQGTYKRTLVIPMTIWKETYFTEVMDGLRTFDPNLYHFCLTASTETIHDRLRQRAEQAEEAWVFQQTAKCVQAFQSPLFREQIDTTLRDADEIVDLIFNRISLDKR